MTTALRNSAITAARAAFETLMTATASVYRRADTSDSAGGHTSTYTLVFTSNCAYAKTPVTPLERENAVTVQTLLLWNFSFPVGTVIVSTDRIVVDAREFEVITAASGSLELLTRAVCREIT